MRRQPPDPPLLSRLIGLPPPPPPPPVPLSTGLVRRSAPPQSPTRQPRQPPQTRNTYGDSALKDKARFVIEIEAQASNVLNQNLYLKYHFQRFPNLYYLPIRIALTKNHVMCKRMQKCDQISSQFA
ncbi:hypothetical protein WR25_18669 [Diploscapter pachys]|uniref:Uncharacterized protein n=1 Tax=Diploscapter pachys TaxID=2018661 RepID=A0A2A2L204_9BILA|nr:hypothetical protein WR25_18669 [Diploscapter pachys]